MKKQSSSLLLLTSAAMALPAIDVAAASVADTAEIGLRSHHYQEENIDDDLVTAGSPERYTIKANQFMLIAPLSDSVDISVNYQHETLSGASPWYTIKIGDDVTQVLSGATISEKRDDYSIKVRKATDSTITGFTYAKSSENDYDSDMVGLDFSYESDDKLTTYSIAGDYSSDVITPVDTNDFTPPRVQEADKESWSMYAGLTQVVNKDLLVGIGFGTQTKQGYLSDPYKQVFIPSGLIVDSRPSERVAYTLSGRMRYFINPANAALHADYRYFTDDWGIQSNTLDLGWYQNINEYLQLVPFARYYSQSSADFYAVFYDAPREDGYYSNDYRLSSYGAMTYGLKANLVIEHWAFTASYETYQSKGSLGIGEDTAYNPGLVDFNLFNVGLNYKF